MTSRVLVKLLQIEDLIKVGLLQNSELSTVMVSHLRCPRSKKLLDDIPVAIERRKMQSCSASGLVPRHF